MGTKEFLDKYPQWLDSWNRRKYFVVGKKGQKDYKVPCICPLCGVESWVRWQPCIVNQHSDGSIPMCRDCRNTTEVRRLVQLKRNETIGTDGLSNIAKRRAIAMKESGWYNSEEWQDIKRRSFETQKSNGTLFRSNLELQIEEEFGGQHYFDGKYEIDVYYPELHLGVEVDDPSHIEVDNPGEKQKRKGYHRDKDAHFRDKGITILHLTFHRSGWREEVQSFLEGTYEGPLIDLTDPTYGDIVY